MAAVSGYLEQIEPVADVVVITFTTPARAAAYQRDYATGVPVLLDDGRSAYRAFGLGRGRIGRVWGLRAARRYAELVRTEGLGSLRRPREDTLQLGGDFVIAPDGRLAWGHWGQGPDDRPPLDTLVGAVRRAAEAGDGP